MVAVSGFLWFNEAYVDNDTAIKLDNATASTGTNTVSEKKLLAKPKSPPPGNQVKVSRQEVTTEQHKPLSPIDRIRAIQQKTALHEAILRDHESFTRYPEYNQQIASQDRDPTTERYKIDERTTLDEETHTALTIWTDKKYYLHGDEVSIFASLEDENQTPVPSQFVGQLIYDERVNLQQFDFKDEDQNGVYQHRFVIDDEKSAGLYKVLIVNKSNKLADAITFTLSKPNLELTGNYRDKLNALGNLLIEAEIKVNNSERFYFQASLYSANNLPIGSTQHSIELDAGTHWIPLEFDGLLIQDAQEEGPYLLKHLSMAKVALPIQVAPLKQPEYYTKVYSLSQFRSSQYAAKE